MPSAVATLVPFPGSLVPFPGSPEGQTGGMTDVPAAGASGSTIGGYSGRRISYATPALLEADLAAHPLAQFERWYADAVRAGEIEPNAMVLATVGPDGLPSARTVLLKQADARGFVFYTNYDSRKAAEIRAHGPVAAVFVWGTSHRQVCVQGLAERVGREETVAYFGQRPWTSRIGAWASRQSAPLADRSELDRRWAELASRWPDRGGPDDVPVPEHWGGFVIRPVEVEFWQGRPNRLHDRLVFLPRAGGHPPAADDSDGWRIERRQP